MTRRVPCLFAIAAFCFATPMFADVAPPPDPATQAGERLPGVALAESVSQLTGVAISPLLGVCGVGVWEYFKASPETRDGLPWFCSPWFWGGGFGLLGLLLAKDVFGSAMPVMLKKPFDMLELFEDKISAVVASAALLPFLNHQLSAVFDRPATVALSELTTASATPVLAMVVLFPLALIAFFAVWLCNHAVNVLLLLSPFGMVDLVVKAMRLGFLAFLTLLAAVAPFLAAVLCGVLVIMALWLAPRAFRISFFGAVMSFDFLRSMVWNPGETRVVRAFLARRAGTAFPSLTFGRLQRTESGIEFTSRHLVFGPRKSLRLGAGAELEKGYLFPGLQVDEPASRFHLLPRHRQDLARVAESLGVTAIIDPPMVRGVKAAFRKIADAFAPGQARITSA